MSAGHSLSTHVFSAETGKTSNNTDRTLVTRTIVGAGRGIEAVITKIITTKEADEEDITTAGGNIITTKEGGRALSGMIIKTTQLSLFSESQVALL